MTLFVNRRKSVIQRLMRVFTPLLYEKSNENPPFLSQEKSAAALTFFGCGTLVTLQSARTREFV
jgi:hypothetical protein